MLDLILITIQFALVYGLAGMAVRLAMAVQGGFDLSPAIAAVLAAETCVALGNLFNGSGSWGLLVAAIGGFAPGGAVGLSWSAFSARFLGEAADGKGVLLASLGLLMLVSGMIGLARGPGLTVLNLLAGETVPVAGIVLSASLLVALAVSLLPLVGEGWHARTRSGYALAVFVMNEPFAVELGVNQAMMRRHGLVLACLLGAGAGMSLGLVNGSYPDLGLKVFLYGAGAALLFESRALFAPVLAGALFGAAHVVLQLVIAPSWAESVMFAAVVALILGRGTGRELGGNR